MYNVLVANSDYPRRSLGEDGTLGPDWQVVGTIEDSQQEAFRRVRHYLGLNGGRSTGFTFWLSGDPDSPWVQASVDAVPALTRGSYPGGLPPFWLAIKVDNRDDYLVGCARSEFRPSPTHPPEPHPGLRTRGVMLPIRVSAKQGVVFERVH